MNNDEAAFVHPAVLALEGWLRKVALFSNDGWLAREAHEAYVELTGEEPEL